MCLDLSNWTSSPVAAPTRSAGCFAPPRRPARPPRGLARGEAPCHAYHRTITIRLRRQGQGRARGAVRLLRRQGAKEHAAASSADKELRRLPSPCYPSASPLTSQGAGHLRAVCLSATATATGSRGSHRHQAAATDRYINHEEEIDKKRGSTSTGEQRAASYLPPADMDMEHKGKHKERKRGREGGSAGPSADHTCSAFDAHTEKKAKKKNRERSESEDGVRKPLKDLSSAPAGLSADHTSSALGAGMEEEAKKKMEKKKKRKKKKISGSGDGGRETLLDLGSVPASLSADHTSSVLPADMEKEVKNNKRKMSGSADRGQESLLDPTSVLAGPSADHTCSTFDAHTEKKAKKKNRERSESEDGVRKPLKDLSSAPAGLSADHTSSALGAGMEKEAKKKKMEKSKSVDGVRKIMLDRSSAPASPSTEHTSSALGVHTEKKEKKKNKKKKKKTSGSGDGGREPLLDLSSAPAGLSADHTSSALGAGMEKEAKKKKRGKSRNVDGVKKTMLDRSSTPASPSTEHNAMKLEKIRRLKELEKEAAALRAEIAQPVVDGEDICQGHSYNEFLKIYNRRKIEFSACGLINKYNTCFLNAVLQCFTFTRPLLAFLLRDNYGKECSKSEEEWCLLCGMRRYIHSARDCKSSYYPDEIIDHMKMIAGNDFILGVQHDASEFMVHARGKMESDFFAKHSGDAYSAEENIIYQIFGGLLRSEITCPCGNVSTSDNKMMDMQVEIGGSALSLVDCLRMYTTAELLDGFYNCTSCKNSVKATKRLSIYQSPNIITIILKRYKGAKKLDKIIHFPMDLDITEYMSNIGGDNTYDLYAVVTHMGRTPSSGHYTCYVKDYEGRWLLFNDTQVKIVSENEVQHKDAYMLFYIRRTARTEESVALKQTMVQRKGQEMSVACDVSKQMDKKETEESRRYDCIGKTFKVQDDTISELYKKRKLGNYFASNLCKEKFQETYLIVEDIEKEVILERIKEALEFYEEIGTFRLPFLGKMTYDEELEQICMVNKGHYPCRSSTKVMRIAAVLKVIRKHLQEDTFILQRAIYYIHKKLFMFNSYHCDEIITDVCRLLRCTRESLNITVSGGGSVIGPVVLYVNSHIEIDCWKCGTSGTNIPHEAHQINKIVTKGEVKFILIIEKKSVFSILAGLGFHRKYNCIMITGGGQPELPTRALAYKLARVFDVPVYGFADANAHGIRIMCTYKFGSERRAFDNLELSVPRLQWIGLNRDDLLEKPDLTQLSELDSVMLTNLLNLDHIRANLEWRSMILSFMDLGFQADIEQILDYDEIEGYLCRRIFNRDADDSS